MIRASRLAIHCVNHNLPVRFCQVSSLIHPLNSDQTITEGPSWVTITPPYVVKSPRELSRQLRAQGEYSEAHAILRKAGVLHSYSQHDLIELLLVLQHTDEFSGPHERLNAMLDALWTIPTRKPKRAFHILLNSCIQEAAYIPDKAIVKLATVKNTAQIVWREAQQSKIHIEPTFVASMYRICGFCRALDLARRVQTETNDPVIDASFSKSSSEEALVAYILCLGKCGRPIEAEQLFFAYHNRSLRNSPQVLGALFNAYLSASRVSKAEILISGHGPYFLSLHDCKSFIRQCADLHLFDIGFAFLDKMERSSETGFPFPDASTYNILLHGLSVASPSIETSFANTAKDIITRMKDLGIEPTVITYNSLIRSHVLQGQMNEAMELFQSMETFDAITLNNLMLGAANINDAEIASELLATLKSARLRPTYGLCKSYLYIMASVNGADYALNEAKSLVSSFGNVISFGDVGSEEAVRMALIYACGKTGNLSAAFRALNARIGDRDNEKGIFAPLYVATVLMQACLDCGREGQALEVFESLKAASRSQPSLQPNFEVFESLIKGLCAYVQGHANQRHHVKDGPSHKNANEVDHIVNGDDVALGNGDDVALGSGDDDCDGNMYRPTFGTRKERASAIFEHILNLVCEMHKCGAARTTRRATSMYNKVIDAASSIGQFDIALEVFRRMTRHSNVNVLYMSSRAGTEEKLSDSNEAVTPIQRPELDGCDEFPRATVYTYNAMMAAAWRSSCEAEALMVFNRMQTDHETRPNEATLNILSDIGLTSHEPSIIQAILLELDRSQLTKRVARKRVLLRQKLLGLRWSS